jgi:methyl coenzyme M reductase gamma subunit
MQTKKRTQRVNRTRVITYEDLEKNVRQVLSTGLLDPLKMQLRGESTHGD